MAVLYRVNALSRVLEEELRREGIPYVIARGTAFYDRKEIRDALSYLRMLGNPSDEVALARIINRPPRGIGGVTLAQLKAHAVSNRSSLLQACRDTEGCDWLGRRAVGAVTKFAQMVGGWRERLDSGDSTELGELVSMVLAESGLERMDALASEDDRQRQANLGELVSAASEFSPPSAAEEDGTCSLATALREYLESVALVSDSDFIDPEQGAVTLMTLHAAKGLEYPMVAVIGVEDGLLPHSRASENEPAMEEERRLLFVGMTRAERRLLLCAASVRTMRGMRQATMRSRFLDEIPAEHCSRTERDPHAGAFKDLADSGIEYDEPAAFDAEELSRQFSPGTLVRHQQFGTGVVETFMPRRGSNAVTVRFKAIGRKTLVLEYARLIRLEGY
jgi:DNA helicase-2/ATP-dependent DNA helicase PcrA